MNSENINKYNEDGITLLMSCLLRGKVKASTKLISNENIDLRKKCEDGFDILYYAVMGQSVACVKKILSVEIRGTNHYNFTNAWKASLIYPHKDIIHVLPNGEIIDINELYRYFSGWNKNVVGYLFRKVVNFNDKALIRCFEIYNPSELREIFSLDKSRKYNKCCKEVLRDTNLLDKLIEKRDKEKIVIACALGAE